jgi:uncharacterized protein YggU (UPF0235/DUF167 family)
MAEAVTRLRLRVVPGARATRLVGRHGAAWKVRVAAAPERGAANAAVVRLLAETLAVPERGITLVSGRTARDKILEIAGITPAETEARLASAERKDSRR